MNCVGLFELSTRFHCMEHLKLLINLYNFFIINYSQSPFPVCIKASEIISINMSHVDIFCLVFVKDVYSSCRPNMN